MCCFILALIFVGPRIGFLIYWLLPVGRIQVNLAFNTFIWPFLGLIFLPWTTLMYSLVYGVNGVVGLEWLWLGLALLADIASYSGGAYKRREVPYYPSSAP